MSDFQVKQADPACSSAARLEWFDPSKYAASTFSDELCYGKLFAYLFRRFGPPMAGWDHYKEIACYYLTTPMDGVWLRVIVRSQNPFGYALSLEVEKLLCKEHRLASSGSPAPGDLRSQTMEALKTTIEDLKRPVHVRDGRINALGKTEVRSRMAKPFEFAGYGVTEEYFEQFRGEE